MEPQVRVGGSVILNTLCVIGQDAVVEDGAHVGGRVTVGALARIGRGALLEPRAVMVRDLSVGAGSIVGACSGAEDIHEGVVACGIPAKIVREV